MTINYSYNIDDKILNYKGRTSQNLYVKKTIQGSDTTYTVLPIRAKSKLGVWLQEHSRFFNFLITWFHSKKIQKDANCLLLKKDRVNPEPQHNHVLEKIIYRITRSTTGFFKDNDKDSLMRNFFGGILDNFNTTDEKKTEWIISSLTANGKLRNKRAEILFDVMRDKNYFSNELFDQIFARYDDMNENTKELTISYAYSHLGHLNDLPEIASKGLKLPNLDADIKNHFTAMCLLDPNQYDSEDTYNASLNILKGGNKDQEFLFEDAKNIISREISNRNMNKATLNELVEIAEAIFYDPILFSKQDKEKIITFLNRKMSNNNQVKFSDHLMEQLLPFIQNNGNNWEQLNSYLAQNSIFANSESSQTEIIIDFLGDSYNFDLLGGQLQQVAKYILENQDDFDDELKKELFAFIVKNNKTQAAQEFKLNQFDQYPFLKQNDNLILAEMILRQSKDHIEAMKLLFNNFNACTIDQRKTAVDAYLHCTVSKRAPCNNLFERNLGIIIEGILLFSDPIKVKIYDYILTFWKQLNAGDVLNGIVAALSDPKAQLTENNYIHICNFISAAQIQIPQAAAKKIMKSVLVLEDKDGLTEVAANYIANYALKNANEFNLEEKGSYLSWIIENDMPFDEDIVAEAEKQATALIHGGPFTQNQIDDIIIPLAELMVDLSGEEASEAASKRLIDFRFWGNKNNFTVNAQKKQYDISILLDLVTQSPEKVLELFHRDCFSKDEGINRLNIIALNDSFKTEKGKNQADDKGGVSRQFIANLFENLVKNSEKIAFVKGKTGFYLPKSSNTSLTKEEEMLYEAIGKLMGMCLTSKGYLLIGQIFDPKVYEIISHIYPHVLNVRFENLSDETLVKIYEAVIGNDETLERYQSLSSRYYVSDKDLNKDLRKAYDFANAMFPDWPETLPEDPSDDELRDHLDDIRNELKSMIVEEARANESLLPIFTICQGIAKHYRSLKKRNDFDDPADMDSEVMIENIQGNFSKRLVKQSLMFLKNEYQQTVDEYRTLEGYFHRWIDESDDEQVRKFLIVTTGSKTIGFEAGIDVNVNNYDYRKDDTAWPSSNTCVKQITIQNYPSYALFKKKLDETIRNAELTGMGFDKE